MGALELLMSIVWAQLDPEHVGRRKALSASEAADPDLELRASDVDPIAFSLPTIPRRGRHRRAE
jgi:hypothetical protein